MLPRRWLLLLALPLCLRADEPREARVVPDSVPAAGRRTAVVSVPRFGRYSIAASSASGVAVTVVDRMSGPGARRGAPGEEDGRVDLFLDRGDVRVVTNGEPNARGRAKLSVRPFVELGGGGGGVPPRLLELRSVDTTLGDHEQRSWWISVDAPRFVAIEAAGRRLADLRLWREGSWLHDAEPESEVTMPAAGRPMRVLRLATHLEKGLYLLSAYGGPGEPWAEETRESAESPLHLRWGIPREGVAGRARRTVGPSGVDRVLVDARATFFGLEVPEARAIAVNARAWDEKEPFKEGDDASSLAAIDKKTNPPEARVEIEGREEGLTLVTVRGEAGQPYVLTHFEKRESYPIRASGEWWIGTLPSSDARDAVDATGLLLRDEERRPLESAAAEVGPGRPWSSRGNLDGPLSVFFHVASAGKYEVEAAGADARMQIAPALAPADTEKVRPLALRGRGTVDLDAGWWQLTARPVKKGIVTLSIRAAGDGSAKAPAPGAPRGGVLFPSVALSEEHGYLLVVGERPGVATGLVLRRIPLDLDEPLPVAARPGEAVTVPFEAKEEVVLAAATEDGDALAVSVDGAPPVPRPRAGAGRHTARVTLPGEAPRVLSIAALPRALEKDVPLPPLPDGALAALPKLPALVEGETRTADLAEGESATYALTVPSPALYRVETTGLLATGAVLRTRTVTQFRNEAENGTGRNALVADFLREGDYQVTVAPRGHSAGHLGVALTRTAVVDGGAVTDGIPARLSLAAGAAATLRLDVARAGTYRIRALGLRRKFSVRLEDAEGWPLVKPGVDGDLRRTLTKGTYRLVVLPFAVPARVVVSLDRVRPPLRFRGHGPHALGLGAKASARWMEPAAGAARTPDRFTFRMPARAAVKVLLTAGMEGKLVASGGVPPFDVPAGKDAPLTLEAGAWTLEVVSPRRDSRVEYEVAVEPEPLVDGLQRAVTAPAEVPVAIGEAGLHELASFGGEDVRARLYDASGALVAQDDDRPDDWNFAITRSLAPGSYTLRVDPAGAESASCRVALRRLPTKVAPKEALPIAREVSPGRGVLEIPVDVPAGALVEIAAEASESVGIAGAGEDGTIYAQETGRAPRVAVPAFLAGPARVVLFSADGRGGAVRLSARAVPMARWTERQLASGGTPPEGAAWVALEHPGVFRFEGPARVAAAVPAPAVPVEGPVAANGDRLVVAAQGTVRAARVRLDERPLALDARAAHVDLAPSAGPVLVSARAATGQPALALARGAATAGERSALAAALKAPGQAVLEGNAGLSGVVLSRLAFAAPRAEPLARRSFEGTVPAHAARAFALPSGSKRLRIALDAGLVALVTRSGSGEALAGDADGASDETLETDGDLLTLLSASGEETRFALDLFEASSPVAPLAPGTPFEASLPEAGTLRLPVAPAPEPRTLHVRGASGAATLLAGGAASRGTDLPVPAGGGTLLLPHGPSLVLAWVDRAGHEAEDLFGAEAPAAAVSLRTPAAPPLAGAAAAFDVDAGGPALVALRASGPALTMVVREGSAPEVAIHETAVALDAYAPAGRARVLVRALSGGTLSGRAAFTASAVTKVGEGLGPESLLGAGQSRLYGFHVARGGAVGVGVRASSDVVAATLLSSSGARLGEGLVQMRDLAPGDYLLAVRAPADAPPVRIRPAIAGLEAPGTGPPPDVIRSYVAPEEAVKGASATRVEDGDEPPPPPTEEEAEEAAAAERPVEGEPQ